MSTISATSRDVPPPARRATPWPNWLREPLLHFVVLGAVLFAVDHVVVGRADDPRTIVIGADVDRDARQLFKASRGREPDAEELAALRRVWLDNEVLYREGLALQVDKGDTAIRERVIFKALSVIDASVKLPSFDDRLLRDWFENHRDRYDEPARYDFQEAVLAGDASESTVRAFAAALNAGAPGDAKAGLRVFKGRPHANLVQSYGPEFAKALEESLPGEWRAQRSRDGWRALRLDAATPSRPAVFEALRGVVLQDWTDATLSEQRSAAVRALTKKYTLKTEAAST
ncbi:MAG: peptidyl-prolyl cis-trans isomerase [Burkholderiaceae bacterium]